VRPVGRELLEPGRIVRVTELEAVNPLRPEGTLVGNGAEGRMRRKWTVWAKGAWR
jgi:hypothetical protein